MNAGSFFESSPDLYAGKMGMVVPSVRGLLLDGAVVRRLLVELLETYFIFAPS